MQAATITTRNAKFDVNPDTISFEAGWLHYVRSDTKVSVPSEQVLDVRIPMTVRG